MILALLFFKSFFEIAEWLLDFVTKPIYYGAKYFYWSKIFLQLAFAPQRNTSDLFVVYRFFELLQTDQRNNESLV